MGDITQRVMRGTLALSLQDHHYKQMNSTPSTFLPNEVWLKIYGTDEDGKPFFEAVSASRLTLKSAMVCASSHRLRSGAILGVQYGGRKARAQVVWICQTSQQLTYQMGIQLREAETCPWVEHTAGTSEKHTVEQRRHQRFNLRVGLELRQPDSSATMQAQCTDISLCGCYVHTILPLAVGTLLVAGLWIGAERIEVMSQVRTCDVNVGMGIEFLDLTDDQRIRLGRFLTLGSATPVQG